MGKLTGLLGVMVVAACGRVGEDPGNVPPAAGAAGELLGAAGQAAGGVSNAAGAAGAAGATTGGGGAMAGHGGSFAGGSSEAGASGAPAEPHPYRALHIALGGVHSCALLEDHRLKCWGANFFGQLGLGNMIAHGLTGMGDELPLVDLGTGRTAKAVAAGRYATCAILDDDSVKCWGENIMSVHLPNGGLPFALGATANGMGDALPVVPLGAGHYATKIGLGYWSGCVALEDGRVGCAAGFSEAALLPAAPGISLSRLVGGTGVIGFYSDGTLRSLGAPSSPIATNVVSVGSADHHLVTWSSDKVLRLDSSELATLPQVYSLSVAQTGAACAITGDHRVHCWRAVPPEGQALDADGSFLIPLPGDAVELAGNSYYHECALLADGSVWCWDWPFFGPSDAAVGGTPAAPKRVDLGTWHP